MKVQAGIHTTLCDPVHACISVSLISEPIAPRLTLTGRYIYHGKMEHIPIQGGEEKGKKVDFKSLYMCVCLE